MSRHGGKDHVQRSVRATDEEVRAILDRLDHESRHPKSAMRKRERFHYRVRSCTVRLMPPGAPATCLFLAPTRNLSAGGMAFLHGGFVHAGVRCMAQLVTTDGHWIEVAGQVVRCRYIENWVHEVCMEFDAEIRPGDFCEAALKMHLLVVEPDDSDAGLAAHHLAMLHCNADRAVNAEEIDTQMECGTFHGVLLDTDSPDLDTAAIIRGLREKGFDGVVVAVTDSPSPHHRERCLETGCADYFIKPYAPDRLRPLLARLRQEPPAPALLKDAATAPAIGAFLEQMPARIRALEEALAGEQLEALATAVRTLRDEAGTFGFESLASAADAMQALLDTSGTGRAKLGDELEQLIGHCLLTRRATLNPEDAVPSEAPGVPAADAPMSEPADDSKRAAAEASAPPDDASQAA